MFAGIGWALPPLGLFMDGWVLGFVAVVLYSSLLIGMTIAAAGSVSREREHRTLDGPGGREAVLRAKWLGSLQGVRGRAFGLILLLMFGGITGNLPGLAQPFLALSAAAHIGFFASLGIYLSVVARSTARACLSAALCLLGLSLLPPMVACGLSPPVVVWRLTLPASEPQSLVFDGALFGFVIYTVTGRLLWWLASERFRREADGERRR
jgi:hypothetical protein